MSTLAILAIFLPVPPSTGARALAVRSRMDDTAHKAHAFANAAFGMAIVSSDDRFIEVNQAFAAMHGGNPADWAGRSVREMYDEKSKALLADVSREVQETGAAAFQSVHVRLDGTTFPVLTKVSAFRDSAGRIVFQSLSFKDLSAGRNVGIALELERVRMKRLLEGAPFAVVAYEGPDHRAVLSNPKHDEMTDGRIVIGRPLLEAIPELAGEPVMQALDEVYRTGKTRTVRSFPSQLQRNGSLQQCWFDVTWQPMFDAEGAVNGVLVSAVEVTDHVLARQRIEAARAVAESAQQLTATITTNATLGLVLLDERQHCTFMNPAAERILGYALSELLAFNRPFHDIVHHTACRSGACVCSSNAKACTTTSRASERSASPRIAASRE